MTKKLYFLILSSLISVSIPSLAGVLHGSLIDDHNEALYMAQVKVKNQALGTHTDIDGVYSFELPDGHYTIEFAYMGMEPITKEVDVKGDVNLGEIIMMPKAVAGNEVVIVAKKINETSNALLVEQKNSVTIEERIGSQEMSKKGVGDAEGAVKKISGVMKASSSSDGSVFVRGLGDRYISTTLNGLSLPSESPELKNINLSFFPTNIIKNISVNKTYQYYLLGDFGGAGIDIESKTYEGNLMVDFKLGTGYNFLTNKNAVYTAGMSKWGVVRNPNLPENTNTQYVFKTIWSPEKLNSPYLNNNYSLSFGTSAKFGKGLTWGLFVNNSYKLDYHYNKGISKVIDASSGFENQNYIKESSGFEVNKSTLVNTYLRTQKGNYYGFNFLNVGNSTTDYSTYFGRNTDITDVAGENTFISRNLQEVNNVNVFQFLTQVNISKSIKLKGGVAYNKIKASQPDRTTNTLIEKNGEYRLSTNSAANQNLYYQFVNENQLASNLGLAFNLGQYNEEKGKSPMELYVGASYINKTKDFSASQFNFKANSTPYGVYNPSNLNSFFNSDNFESELFSVNFFRWNPATGEVIPNTYTGKLNNLAFVANLNWDINDRWNVSGGFRQEKIDQGVKWDVATTSAKIPKGSNEFINFKTLPFANARMKLTEKSNLKFAASKTYTLPQFKEVAPFLYEGIGTNSFGNPFVYASDNYNLDAKWELFPNMGELVSAGVFYKYIANPINKAMVPNSSNDLTYVNTGNYAQVAGIELDVRKKLNTLLQLDAEKNDLTVGFNLSALYSHQELNNQKIYNESNGWISGNFTDRFSALQGASPIVMNADISYKTTLGNYVPTVGVVFNYFYDQVFSIGMNGAGNQYLKGVPTLDLITSHSFGDRWNIGFNVKNILNPNVSKYQVIQPTGDKKIIGNYKTGTVMSLSISYKIN